MSSYLHSRNYLRLFNLDLDVWKKLCYVVVYQCQVQMIISTFLNHVDYYIEINIIICYKKIISEKGKGIMSNYKDYKDAYMVCLRALFGDILTMDEDTFVLLDASFASVEEDGNYICSKGFERWLQKQLPYIYGVFLSREDFVKNVYEVMYNFVATGKEHAFEVLNAQSVNDVMSDRVYTVTFQNFSQNIYMQWLDLIKTRIAYLNSLSEWVDEKASNMTASHKYMLTFILFNFPVMVQLLMRDENFLNSFEIGTDYMTDRYEYIHYELHGKHLDLTDDEKWN